MSGKTIAIAVGAVLAVATGVVYTAFSYVTAAGDETRFGMRVARRLGIKSNS